MCRYIYIYNICIIYIVFCEPHIHKERYGRFIRILYFHITDKCFKSAMCTKHCKCFQGAGLTWF